MTQSLIQYLIVGLIVAAAAWHAGSKYLPKSWRARLGYKSKAAGCASGCDSCNNCETPAVPPAQSPEQGKHRVIKLHMQ